MRKPNHTHTSTPFTKSHRTEMVWVPLATILLCWWWETFCGIHEAPYTKEWAVAVLMTPRGIWLRCLAGGSFSSDSRNKRGWRIFHMDPGVWWRKLSGVRGGGREKHFDLCNIFCQKLLVIERSAFILVSGSSKRKPRLYSRLVQ